MKLRNYFFKKKIKSAPSVLVKKIVQLDINVVRVYFHTKINLKTFKNI